MTVNRAGSARQTQATSLSRSQEALVDKLGDLNRRAKLGSLSIRFQVGSKEIKPRDAIERLAHGDKVTATLVTWKTFKGGDKIAPTSRKVRVKVRGIDAKDVSSVGAFEKFWKAAEKEAKPDAPSRPRSTHPTKRS